MKSFQKMFRTEFKIPRRASALRRSVFSRLCLAILLLGAGGRIFAGSKAAFAGEEFNLEKTLDLALKNNPELLSAYQDLAIAGYRIKEARSLYYPQFSVSGSLSKFNLDYPMVMPEEFGGRYFRPSGSDNFYAMRVYAFQPIYTGGRNKNNVRIAKTAEKEARVRYEIIRQKALYEAKKAYYDLLYKKKMLELHDRWLGELESRSFSGDEISLLELKSLTGRIESSRRYYEKQFWVSQNYFKKIVGRESDAAVSVSGDIGFKPRDLTLESALITAMDKRPELKGEIYKAKIDDISVNMAIMKRYPNVYLGASYDVLGYDMFSSGGDVLRYNNWVASVALKLPLSWDWWTQVLRRKARQRQGELKRSSLRDDVRFEVINAFGELAYWQEEVARRKESAAQARKVYRSRLKKRLRAFDFSRLVEIMFETEKRSLEAIYENAISRLKFELAQGKELGD